MIEIKNISKKFGKLEVLKDINLSCKKGECIALIGPNGCGKSSLFRILGNLWPIRGGIVKKPNYRNIFYIPQRPYLPNGSLRDQIIYPHSYQEFKSLNRKDEESICSISSEIEKNLDFLNEIYEDDLNEAKLSLDELSEIENDCQNLK